MAVFNEIANDYDDWYKTKLGEFVDKIETKAAFELLNVKSGDKILDAGCGTGNFTKKIKESNKNIDIIGIDISAKMLSIAKQKNPNIKFKKMDLNNLKFDDNTFDKIISMAAFEFIKKPKKVINELLRVLKPKGELIIGTINPNSKWGEMYQSKEFKDTIFKHAIFHTIDDLSNIKKNKVKDIKKCLFTPPDIDINKLNKSIEEEFTDNRPGFYIIKWIK